MRRVFLSFFVVSGIAGSAFGDSLEKIAKKLSDGAQALANRRVAVLPFPYYDGLEGKGSPLIVERLTLYLTAQKKLEAIEPAVLENVLKELKIGSAMDEESAGRIGKALGLDAVINGTLIDLNAREVEVSARLILLDGRRILASWSGPVDRSWTEDAPQDEAGENFPAIQDVTDDGPGFGSLPLEVFIAHAGFTPETAQTDFGEEWIGGIKMIRNGDGAAAEHHFKKMHERLKDSPKMDSFVLLGLSASLFEQRRQDKAFKMAEEIVRQDRFPGIASVAHFFLGKYHEMAEESSQAEKHYLDMIRASPFPSLLVSLAGQHVDEIRGGRRDEKGVFRAIRRELRKGYSR